MRYLCRDQYLDGFWIDKTEVTVAQYRRFCQATSRAIPSAPNGGWHDDHPIVNVTWDDATAYVAWAGKRLPTEAEWEKAARGTDGRQYPWGNEWDPSKCVNNTGDGTRPVGSYSAGASPYGALDMAGNVYEWCADWRGDYDSASTRNPTGPSSGDYRVLRGGSWLHDDPTFFRCAGRISDKPDSHYRRSGFRCVRGPGLIGQYSSVLPVARPGGEPPAWARIILDEELFGRDFWPGMEQMYRAIMQLTGSSGGSPADLIGFGELSRQLAGVTPGLLQSRYGAPSRIAPDKDTPSITYYSYGPIAFGMAAGEKSFKGVQAERRFYEEGFVKSAKAASAQAGIRSASATTGGPGRVRVLARPLGLLVISPHWISGPYAYWLFESAEPGSPGAPQYWAVESSSMRSEVDLKGRKWSEAALYLSIKLRVEVDDSQAMRRFFCPSGVTGPLQVEGTPPATEPRKLRTFLPGATDLAEDAVGVIEWTGRGDLRDVPILVGATINAVSAPATEK